MKSPRDFYPVRAGETIRERHVNGLSEMVAERTYRAGRGCRARVVPGFGVYFEVEKQSVSWHHAWEVKLSGAEATVAPGLLNGEMPWVDDGRGLRALDGLDDEGEKLAAGVPGLRLSEETFSDAGYSWIALRVEIAPATGARVEAKLGGLTVVQTMENSWMNGGSRDVVEKGKHYGHYPLAMMRRAKSETEGFGTLTQNAMFHLQHRFVAGEKRGTHFFWV